MANANGYGRGRTWTEATGLPSAMSPAPYLAAAAFSLFLIDALVTVADAAGRAVAPAFALHRPAVGRNHRRRRAPKVLLAKKRAARSGRKASNRSRERGRSSERAGGSGSGAGFGRRREDPTSAPPPPTAAGGGACASASAAHADLLSWLHGHSDAYISPKFSVMRSDLGGYGGFAASPMHANELIMRVPRSACVTHDDALNDPLCGDRFRTIKEARAPSWGMVLISGWIAKEYLCSNLRPAANEGRCAEESRHRCYLDTLPWERGMLGQDHVLFWSDEEVERFLGGSFAHDDTMLIRDTVDGAVATLKDFVTPLVRGVRLQSKSKGEFGVNDEYEDSIDTTFERAVRGAFVIALSRSFAEEVELEDGTVEVENLLIPGIDLLQHSNEPNTVLEPYDDCVILRARSAIGKGDELFHRYQEEDNNIIPPHKFFTRYGFVPGTKEPVDELLRARGPLFFDC